MRIFHQMYDLELRGTYSFTHSNNNRKRMNKKCDKFNTSIESFELDLDLSDNYVAGIRATEMQLSVFGKDNAKT